MSSLPNPPSFYDQEYFFTLASTVMEGEKINMRVDRDNIIEPGTIILKSTGSTPKYFQINVSDTGTLSATEVTTINGIPVSSGNPDA